MYKKHLFFQRKKYWEYNVTSEDQREAKQVSKVNAIEIVEDSMNNVKLV